MLWPRLLAEEYKYSDIKIQIQIAFSCEISYQTEVAVRPLVPAWTNSEERQKSIMVCNVVKATTKVLFSGKLLNRGILFQP